MREKARAARSGAVGCHAKEWFKNRPLSRSRQGPRFLGCAPGRQVRAQLTCLFRQTLGKGHVFVGLRVNHNQMELQDQVRAEYDDE
jgi:hypothetical protein